MAYSVLQSPQVLLLVLMKLSNCEMEVAAIWEKVF